MMSWLRSLDRILRGEATRPDAVKNGQIEFSLFGLFVVIVLLSMIYGACMGTFAIFREIDTDTIRDSDRYLQIAASICKVPALFVMTLIVTFPSLYVFNALVGSRLHLVALLKLLIASLAVNVAVLASLGPITAFFSVSTTSYRFMQVFNVAVFSIAGSLGLLFLNQTLNRISAAMHGEDYDNGEKEREELAVEQLGTDAVAEDGTPASPEEARVGAIDSIGRHALSGQVRTVFRIWVIVFCLVGAQMGWVLRPFIGNPNMPFTLFRERQSNFFEAILMILSELLTG